MVKKRDGLEQFKTNETYGIVSFSVRPDTNLIKVDVSFAKHAAIADFVKELNNRLQPRERDEVLALAVGVYDVPLNLLYGEDSTIHAINDTVLGKIIKYRTLRIEEEKSNE
jgi:hypothetical protein